MEIRPHHEQIKQFKKLHVREVFALMVAVVVIPLAMGFPVVASSIFFVEILVAILIISWKMRKCQCPQCGETLTLPWRIRKCRSGGIWEYECRHCDILWTVAL